MAQAKRSSLPAPAPLPLRMWRLHLKLIVAALVGVAIALMLPVTWRLPSRLLFGWDAGIVFYLVIVHAGVYRGGVDSLRRRAKEQDEGAFLILLLTNMRRHRQHRCDRVRAWRIETGVGARSDLRCVDRAGDDPVVVGLRAYDFRHPLRARILWRAARR